MFLVGVILDLQADAINADIDILVLLRKAFLIAKKLKLTDFEEWVDCELNGYKGNLECPHYREISGETKGWNPYNGWIPLLVANNEWYNTLNYKLVNESIASLVSLLKTDGALHIPFPGSVCATINEMTGITTKYALFVSKNNIESIIETVRTKILDWAIVLEENGITGDGLTFSNKEKELAISVPKIIHYINNFYKNADNIQIQQGTENSQQNHMK